MYNCIADVRKGGDFLSKMISRTSCILSRSNRKRSKVQHLHAQTAFATVIFKTLALITLRRILSYTNHVSGKFQSFHVRTAWQHNPQWGPGWLHEPDWPALPRWLLSRHYMNRSSPEPPFISRGLKQRAWAMCYPLACFSLGSFAGPPGQHDYLENFEPGPGITVLGSQLTGPFRLSWNRKVDCFWV